MMSRSTRMIAAAAVPLSLGLLLAPAAGADVVPGNSATAEACQKGGYANYMREDGSRFTSTGQCVSYVARGGALAPILPTVTVRFEPTHDENYCTPIVVVSGFAPLTTYSSQWRYYYSAFPGTGPNVTTDATGSGEAAFASLNAGPSIEITVNGIKSGESPITC